jgi:hypothetical protein
MRATEDRLEGLEETGLVIVDLTGPAQVSLF